jgi:solute carrier family 25 (mitochondrial carnitine/acylcarnitine transporter), member 20/29
LYKGLCATLLREGLGNAAMFGVYELIKRRLADARGLPSPAALPSRDLMVAGGLAGTSFWLACYPVDVVKSKLQLDSVVAPRYQGMLHCARTVVAAEGVAGLFRGFGPALARSFPANAVCFAVYEAASSALQRSLGIAAA